MIYYNNDMEHADVSCDECPKEAMFYGLFKEIIKELIDAKWWIEKDEASGNWTHLCPDCTTLLKPYNK